MADENYVTNGYWLRQVGRPDSIDDVADHFERTVAVVMESFWSRHESARWPGRPRGWRTGERLHRPVANRRVG